MHSITQSHAKFLTSFFTTVHFVHNAQLRPFAHTGDSYFAWSTNTVNEYADFVVRIPPATKFNAWRLYLLFAKNYFVGGKDSGWQTA